MDTDFKINLDLRVLQRIIGQTPETLRQFMDREAERMVNDIKLSFGKGPPGRAYKRGEDKWHIASAPPGPPAVDMNALRGSIKWRSAGDLSREIMDGVEYGIYLEMGTTKMDPRPFMKPAFERERQTLKDRFPDLVID